MLNPPLTANPIQAFVRDMGLTPQDEVHYDAILTFIAEGHSPPRVLSTEMLEHIRTHIHSVPSGRRRRLTEALNHTLLYLQQVCQWQLPEQKANVYRDHTQQWVVNILKHAQLGGALYRDYAKESWALKSKTLSPFELISLLAMEVAPLALSQWLVILATPDSIEVFEERFTLKVFHPVRSKKELPSFTRYLLTPVACHALFHYYPQTKNRTRRKAPLREEHMVEAMNKAVLTLNTGNPLLTRIYPNPISARQWHLAVQSIWHCEYGYPPELLLDLVQPSRHFAFEPVAVSDAHTRKGLKQLYQQPNVEAKETSKTKPAHEWPHLTLLKRLASEPRGALDAELNSEPTLEWSMEDVLPTLFYLFTKELIVYGGVKRNRLRHPTLVKYTSICHHLPRPLSYLDASDPIKLDTWAKQAFESQAIEGRQWLVYNFLRFVSHQALTDHLDVHQFECPTLPINVDAYRLNAEQVQHAANTLLTSRNGNPLQRLFSTVALVLGYYGALRRGEIVRLRLQDVVVTSTHTHQFRLHITQTAEGNTKSGQSRFVHMVLPTGIAKLFELLLSLKQSCPRDVPLLGFEGESLGSRQLHYLYPVTQVLKALYGNQVRFHHLRHSGAHLLYLQGLSLACEHFDHAICDIGTPAELTTEVCEARFGFWLEGREFSQMNDGILLDVIGKELGHQHYATTRLSYLHGIEWLPEFFAPTRAYSINTLNALLGKSGATSLLSMPIIAKQLPSDGKVTPESIVNLTERRITDAVLLSPFGRRLPQHFERALPIMSGRDDEWVDAWMRSVYDERLKRHHLSARAMSVPAFHWQTEALMEALKRGEVSFESVSIFCRLLGKHQDFGFSGRQRRELKRLGPITVIDERRFSVNFACNQLNADAFNTLFRARLFRSFEVSFLLQQNRKQSPERKLSLIRTHYAKSGESITLETIAAGESRFTVTFRFIPDSTVLFDTLIDYLQ
ncbi:hypothetical protein BCT68_07675 [Vibrio breoganii]|nr:hypothetical protein BCT68_07675 [Vibrio breoganii]